MTSAILKRKLIMGALQLVIALRQPPEGVIFHSDRGSEYCSHDYQKVLSSFRGWVQCVCGNPVASHFTAGDIVILDNLSTHKSPQVEEMLKTIKAWFLFLPPYSLDLNPIEIAFAKLKGLIRKMVARSYNVLWQVAGHVCDFFSEEECVNFFKAAGYEGD